MSDTKDSKAGMPFSPVSGCSRVSIPQISAVSVCSLPELARAGVSPTPIVFDVPPLPTPNVAPACIDIKPNVTYRFSQQVLPESSKPPFRTASGHSNCLDGSYELDAQLVLPCLLSQIDRRDEDLEASVTWVSSKEKFKARFSVDPLDSQKCELKPRKLKLNLPRPCNDTVITFPRDKREDSNDIITLKTGEPPKLTLNITIPENVVVTRPGGGEEEVVTVITGCTRELLPSLRLYTAALNPCPRISVVNLNLIQLPPGAPPFMSMTFAQPEGSTTCDRQLDLRLELPCVSIHGKGIVHVASTGGCGYVVSAKIEEIADTLIQETTVIEKIAEETAKVIHSGGYDCIDTLTQEITVLTKLYMHVDGLWAKFATLSFDCGRLVKIEESRETRIFGVARC